MGTPVLEADNAESESESGSEWKPRGAGARVPEENLMLLEHMGASHDGAMPPAAGGGGQAAMEATPGSKASRRRFGSDDRESPSKATATVRDNNTGGIPMV